jgi:integrase/recombinase XerD
MVLKPDTALADLVLGRKSASSFATICEMTESHRALGAITDVAGASQAATASLEALRGPSALASAALDPASARGRAFDWIRQPTTLNRINELTRTYQSAAKIAELLGGTSLFQQLLDDQQRLADLASWLREPEFGIYAGAAMEAIVATAETVIEHDQDAEDSAPAHDENGATIDPEVAVLALVLTIATIVMITVRSGVAHQRTDRRDDRGVQGRRGVLGLLDTEGPALSVMAVEIVAADRRSIDAELVDDSPLAGLAEEVARSQPVAGTRRTYAGVYRSFCTFAGPGAGVEVLTPAMVRRYRDRLELDGRSRATIAKHLSALRTLAAALDIDGVQRVHSATVARGEPRPLTVEQFERLLRMPDRRTLQGKRDLALLHLLGSAGLRRAEACAVLISDVDQHARVVDGRLRQAVEHPTEWWVTVTYGKRGRRRRIPLERDALAAVRDWFEHRPAADSEHLLVSLSRARRPPRPLDGRDVARIVARHAEAAGLPEDRRSPHVLRHTFCTHLANNKVAVEVIRELAGHADIRTTTVYTDVDEDRLRVAVRDAERGRGRGGLGARRLNGSRPVTTLR